LNENAWTCREGQLLQEAVEACQGWGLTFDSVNESLPDWIEEFKTRPRKVGASEYWDDRAVHMPDPNPPLTLAELREMDGEPVWVQPQENNCGIWGFVDKEHGLVRVFGSFERGRTFGICRQFKTYGRTWLAYRRKPEEGTT